MSLDNESQIQWIANEGIRISQICAFLAASYASNALAAQVLQREAPPLPVGSERTGRSPAFLPTVSGDELRLTVPVQIAVRVAAPAMNGFASAVTATSGSRPVAPLRAPAALPSPDVEAVVVDQTSYAKRPGYQPTFLGGGKLRVDLPTLSAALRKLVAPVKGSPSGELKYWNYTVVMNKARGLAFFAAANVDASLRPKNGGRDGDRWYEDTRIAREHQVVQSFYGNQKEFEANRTANPFDRGHLVRRLDAQWGKDTETSTRNGNDSFHFTNCSPQYYLYNQGAKKWLGLEDYVISQFAGGKKACVINGPVFDAPLSREGGNGRLQIQVNGQRHKDPTFGDVAIPKMFFKIVACARPDKSLAVAAFLMSQEDYLRRIGDRLHGMPEVDEAFEVLTDAEAKLYQVRVTDIEKLTGLRFASLAGTDSEIGEELAVGPRELRVVEDLQVWRAGAGVGERI